MFLWNSKHLDIAYNSTIGRSSTHQSIFIGLNDQTFHSENIEVNKLKDLKPCL